MNLTTEQQFQIAAFKLQVRRMTPEQVKEQLVEQYKAIIAQEMEYLKLIGDAWGMGKSYPNNDS